VIGATIKVHFVSSPSVTGQRISLLNLPEAVRNRLDETLSLRMGIGEIEALPRERDDGEGLRFSQSRGAEIAALMNYYSSGSQHGSARAVAAVLIGM
jgi:hypothetical protein